MSISFVWDAAWETIPTDNLPRGDIRGVIGQTAQGTRERMEVEHQWGPNTPQDTGGHRPGYVGVADRGAAVPVANLKSGELYVKDVGGDIQIWLYGDIGAGVQWNLIGTLDHSQLINRNTGDPHPIYLKRAGDDILPNEFKMGGKILRLSGGVPPTFGNLLTWAHRVTKHATIGNLAAVQNSSILSAKVGYAISTIAGSLPNNSRAVVVYYGVTFFPEVTVKSDDGVTKDFRFFFVGNSLQIINRTGVARSWQCRYRTAGKS